jgi:hypothetical protein
MQLSDYELPEVADRLAELRQSLPGVRVEALVDLEPQIMRVRVVMYIPIELWYANMQVCEV